MKKRNVKFQMKQASRVEARYRGAQKILALCARAAPIHSGPEGIFCLDKVSGMSI